MKRHSHTDFSSAPSSLKQGAYILATFCALCIASAIHAETTGLIDTVEHPSTHANEQRLNDYTRELSTSIRDDKQFTVRNRFSKSQSRDKNALTKSSSTKLEWKTRDEGLKLYLESKYKIREAKSIATRIEAQFGLKFSPKDHVTLNMSVHGSDRDQFARTKLKTSLALFF